MLGPRARCAHPRRQPRDPAARRARRRARCSCARCSTCPTTASCSRSSTPAWAPTAGWSASRSAGGVLLGPDNGLLAPAVAMAGRRPDRRLARQPRVPPALARAHLRRARHARPGRRPPRRRRPARRARQPGRPVRAGARAWCRCPRCATTARSSARSGGSTGSATASSTSTPTSSARRGRSRARASRCTLGGEIRAARWVHTYADAKPSELVLLVDSYGLLSLALDRESAAATLAPAGRAAASPWCPRAAGRMRRGTTIMIVILLVLILGAAMAQFVLRLGPLSRPSVVVGAARP